MAPKHKLTWLLVSDGVQAQIYNITTGSVRMELVREGRFRIANKRARVLENGQPGKVKKGEGVVGHPKHRTSAHQRREDAFVDRVADAINIAASLRKFDDLLLAAPPKALAQFRKSLNAAARKKIKAEIRGEWTKLSQADLKKHVAANLATSGPK